MANYKLPRQHAEDWMNRCNQTPRTITLDLSPAAVKDLRADAEHYRDAMHGEWTMGIDYRPAARRCLTALNRIEQDHNQ